MNPHDPITDLAAGFRPWSDDLAAARWDELRHRLENDSLGSERFEQQNSADQQLRETLQQVELPPGLCDRLLVRVAQEIDSLALNQPLPLSVVKVEPTQPVTGLSRRSWMIWSGACAASVALIGGVAAWNLRNQRHTTSISRDELAREVGQWLESYAYLQTSKQWSTAWQAREVAARPVSHIKAQPRRWHKMSSPLDSAAVAYDLRGPGRSTAVLFVIRTQRTYQLPSLPVPGGNLSLSVRKFASAAWQRGDLLYVLVVDEDGVSLADFLQPTRVA